MKKNIEKINLPDTNSFNKEVQELISKLKPIDVCSDIDNIEGKKINCEPTYLSETEIIRKENEKNNIINKLEKDLLKVSTEALSIMNGESEECLDSLKKEIIKISEKYSNEANKLNEHIKNIDAVLFDMYYGIMRTFFYSYFYVYSTKEIGINNINFEKNINYDALPNSLDKLSIYNSFNNDLSSYTSLIDSNFSFISNSNSPIKNIIFKNVQQLLNVSKILSRVEFVNQPSLLNITPLDIEISSNLDSFKSNYISSLKYYRDNYIASFPNGIANTFQTISLENSASLGNQFSNDTQLQNVAYYNFVNNYKMLNSQHKTLLTDLRNRSKPLADKSLEASFYNFSNTTSFKIDDNGIIVKGNTITSITGIFGNTVVSFLKNYNPGDNYKEAISLYFKEINNKLLALEPQFQENLLQIKLLAAIYSKIIPLKDKIFELIESSIKIIRDNYLILEEIYSLSDVSKKQDLLISEIESLKLCNKNIEKDNSEIVEVENINKLDFPANKENYDISKKAYWIKFASVLNSLSLLPQNYVIGLISPAGKTPFPITWIPIFSFLNNGKITVIFVTVSGIVVVPVIYEYNSNKNSLRSRFINLFRGFDVTIDNNTISENLSLPIINGINIDPKNNLNKPLTKDDIPITDRISLKNVLFVNYLNKWINSCKPYMGLP